MRKKNLFFTQNKQKNTFFLLLVMTNNTLVLKFMKSNKFYYFQTAKVVNSQDISWSRIKFCPR